MTVYMAQADGFEKLVGLTMLGVGMYLGGLGVAATVEAGRLEKNVAVMEASGDRAGTPPLRAEITRLQEEAADRSLDMGVWSTLGAVAARRKPQT